jgi:hypothetical protein
MAASSRLWITSVAQKRHVSSSISSLTRSPIEVKVMSRALQFGSILIRASGTFSLCSALDGFFADTPFLCHEGWMFWAERSCEGMEEETWKCLNNSKGPACIKLTVTEYR